jgi:ferric-dicitrate binding protein FerR (iron transport regulator)
MRKALIVAVLLILPSAAFAQSALRASSIVEPVEWRAASSPTFRLLAANQAVQAGDEIRTGPGGSVILTVPDGSYMVVSENSKVVVEDFWSGNFKSLMNLMLGQVRFYIQRFGGRPNPYAVRTPTALIAVRGTIFDVNVDDTQSAEVRCLEGRVTVENLALSDREVILEPGFKTLVRPGEAPLTPVRNEAELYRNRVVRVHPKNVPDSNPNAVALTDILARDNDRRNRPSDPQGANSRINSSTQRAKPTLTFPQ